MADQPDPQDQSFVPAGCENEDQARRAQSRAFPTGMRLHDRRWPRLKTAVAFVIMVVVTCSAVGEYGRIWWLIMGASALTALRLGFEDREMP